MTERWIRATLWVGRRHLLFFLLAATAVAALTLFWGL
jgi:hypothetical protein